MLREQFGMCAAFDDAAVIEHEDLVGIDDGRQAVRDDQGGAFARDLLEFGLDDLLGARIQRAGRFVEHEDRGILEQRARDRDALLLAAGQLQAALADAGVVALRQARDEIVDMRRPRRGDRLPRAWRRVGRRRCCSRSCR